MTYGENGVEDVVRELRNVALPSFDQRLDRRLYGYYFVELSIILLTEPLYKLLIHVFDLSSKVSLTL